MILGLEPGVFAAIALTVVAGATVQGLVGLGVGLVSAPIVTLLAPDLMPGMLLWMGLLTPMLTLARDREDIDWRVLRWAVPFRIPGTIIGVLLVGWFTDRELGIAVGSMVLVSVAVTWSAITLPISRTNLSIAGVLAGIGATTTSIGGPPIAVLYQHQQPRVIRNTLAVFFCVGAVFSLAGLAISRELTSHESLVALALAPCVPLGLRIARLLDSRLPGESIRGGVLVVCAASAIVLVVRSLI